MWAFDGFQITLKFPTGYATTSRPLLHIYVIVVANLWLLCFKYLYLYNNAAKIFGAERVLCRRFENLENKMVYTTRGKCSVYYASRVSVFFLKKVFVCRRLCRKSAVKLLRWQITSVLFPNDHYNRYQQS